MFGFVFRVLYQHNHSDCGLYMLKYIERFAQHGSELEPPLEGMHAPTWNVYEELSFAKGDIIQMRKTMHETITQLGSKQAEGKLKGAPQKR